MKQEYPKYMYHKTKEAALVNSESELSSLGKGWKDSPAAFENEEEVQDGPIDFATLSSEDLHKAAIKAGAKKAQLKEMTDEQIIALLKGSV